MFRHGASLAEDVITEQKQYSHMAKGLGKQNMAQSVRNAESRETDRYISEPELRAYLGYSPSTIHRLRNKGLPSVGKGRLRRFHIASVIQWLSEHG